MIVPFWVPYMIVYGAGIISIWTVHFCDPDNIIYPIYVLLVCLVFSIFLDNYLSPRLLVALP